MTFSANCDGMKYIYWWERHFNLPIQERKPCLLKKP